MKNSLPEKWQISFVQVDIFCVLGEFFCWVKDGKTKHEEQCYRQLLLVRDVSIGR